LTSSGTASSSRRLLHGQFLQGKCLNNNNNNNNNNNSHEHINVFNDTCAIREVREINDITDFEQYVLLRCDAM
jgi:hypothetical protein